MPPAKTLVKRKTGSRKPAAPPPPVVGPPAVLGKARFVYKGVLPVYLEHSGIAVAILRELTVQENELSGMFLIRAADGWEGHAREAELDR